MRPDAGERLTPSAARRRLGEELLKSRRRARLSLDEAARGIERSAATLSRLENGRTIPRLVDVKALIAHYQSVASRSVANGTEERILTLAEIARKEEWFASFRDVLAGELTSNEARRLVEFEGEATMIRSYEPELVPGLLQTEAYAAAVTEAFFPERSDVERQRLVEFRLGRQQILQRGDREVDLRVVIGEAALRHVMGSPAVMREQLNALLADVQNGRSNVTIQVSPLALAIPAVLGGPFAQMDLASEEGPGLVYLEGRESAQFMLTDDAVERYRELFHQLTGAALDAGGSAKVLEEAIKHLPLS
ncbi:helix-turn-helix domain-containing protein [Pseudonocardia xinjiangensis]|uniref:helix-turn-helix domain-containing protein n=1 Tax=Pseudonocardia xinjiangensis TaxID=75289 RepID=UPI003D8D6E14